MPNLVSTILSSLVFALVPMVSQAIGLGNVMLHSHLNEPLDADIAITDIKGIEPSDVIVTVADQKAYEEAGLQPIGWLNSIRFQVTKSEIDGRPVLRLKTKEVVKDPFVDLLIDVKWPGGQLFREFTLLLDPPKSVIPASASIQRNQNISTVIGAQSAKISNSTSRQIEAFPGGVYGPTCDENLWNIAKSLARNSNTNVQHAVMAIAEKNPHAFRGGNINFLLSGVVLKMPDQAELDRYSLQQAQNYIATKGQPSYSKPTAHVEKSETIAQNSPTVNPQRALKLVAPVQSLETALKVNADAPKTQNQAVLADRLTLIEEAIDTLKRANEDMTKKNQSLQDQNQSLEKLLSMKEDEIKKLVEMVKKTETTQTSSNVQQNVTQFAVATSDVPPKPSHPDLADPNISQMVAAKPIKPATVEPNLAETQMKPNAIKVDNIAPHSQPQNKVLSADDTGTKSVPEKTVVSDDSSKLSSSLFGFLLFALSAIILGIAWLRRHIILDFVASMKERLPILHAKQAFTTSNAGSLEMANYGLQFDLEKALDAITTQEKKFKKGPQSGIRLIRDAENERQFYAKYADVEECISYERFGQAEKILNQILQQQPDEWLAVYKLLDLYVLTEKYNQFMKLYEGLPSDLKEMAPGVWSKIEILHQKVTNEAVQFQSRTAEPDSRDISEKQETHEYTDLKTDYPLTLAPDETDNNISIEALPTAEVEELPNTSTSNPQDIQKAQIALAKAYIDMGEYNDAKVILNELKKEAFGEQLKQIEDLLQSIS